MNAMNMGEAVSTWTGEEFMIKDFDQITYTDGLGQEGTVLCHVNLTGEWGSHYIGTYQYDYPSWAVTGVLRTVRPGKKGK